MNSSMNLRRYVYKMRNNPDSITSQQLETCRQAGRLQTTNSSIFAPMKILMVCLGNICRSPMAEGILQHKAKQAGLHWTIDSAGTNGYHIGEAPHRLSQKVAKQHGIDISGLRARRFTAEDFSRFDKIYAMAGDVMDEMKWIAKKEYNPSKTDLLMNELYPGRNMDVPDPWYGPEPGYHEVFAMLNAACDVIVKRYTPKP